MMNETQRSLLFEEADLSPDIDSSLSGSEKMLREIEAVACRAKSMSVFLIPERMIDDDLYIQALKNSASLGIMAALHRRVDGENHEKSGEVFLFFVSREEMWRIPAYLALKRAFFDYDWSDGAEFLEGSLLGYSDSQMTSWINVKRRKRIGWLGLTCYFLMSQAQRNDAKKLANRCIDPASVGEGMEVFYTSDSLIPKQNVYELLPVGMHLGRASIKHDFFRKLFARDLGLGRKINFLVSAINQKNADDLNMALQSNFQFFDP